MPAMILPQTVVLDDLVSMTGAGLAGGAEVEVVVRISRTGSPMHQDGDWQWLSEPLTVPVATALEVAISPP